MNVITIAGNLGRDAEGRYVQGNNGQMPVLNFSLADSKKKQGQDATIWFGCALWGERGPKLIDFLKKGTPVTVIGELQELHTYPKQDGTMGYEQRVRVLEIALQGQAPQNNNQGGGFGGGNTNQGNQNTSGFGGGNGGQGNQGGGFGGSQPANTGGFGGGQNTGGFGNANNSGAPAQQRTTAQQQGRPGAQTTQQGNGGFDQFDDDIPFN